MATTFTPNPKPLSTDELDQVRCALRSGIEPTLDQSRRLLATIDGLQKALVLQAGRMQDLLAAQEAETLRAARIEVAGGQPAAAGRGR